MPHYIPVDFPEIRKFRSGFENFIKIIFDIAGRFIIISAFYASSQITHSLTLVLIGIFLALILTINEATRAFTLVLIVYDIRTFNKKISTQGRLIQSLLIILIGIIFLYVPHLFGSAMIDFVHLSH